MIITCTRCERVFDVPIPPQAVAAWRAGEFIQTAWPEGSPEDRELLISRTCGQCWQDMFGDDDG